MDFVFARGGDSLQKGYAGVIAVQQPCQQVIKDKKVSLTLSLSETRNADSLRQTQERPV